MKKTILASLIGAGALLASTAGMAATISEGPILIGPHQPNWGTNTTITIPGGAIHAPASFAGFDTTLGTLTGVTIMVRSSFDGSMTTTATGPGMSVTELIATDNIIYDLFNNGADVTQTSTSAGSGALGGLFGLSLANGQSHTEALASDTGFSVFDFTAAGGSLADFTSAWVFGCSNTIQNTSTLSGPNDTTFNGVAECEVKVDYDFTPAPQPAPIPGSLLLMAAGLLGFGASRRK